MNTLRPIVTPSFERLPLETRTIKLTVAYDGTEYFGWQVQPGKPTIQGALTEVLQSVVGHAAMPIGASRTDSGVHALGQVAHVPLTTRLSLAELHKALNALLPDDIRVMQVEVVADDFDSIRYATSKTYRYVFHDGRISDPFTRRHHWRIWHRLDDRTMHAAAQVLVGTHDFRCFESNWPNRSTSVRTMYGLSVSRLGDFVTLEVTGKGFLYNMVRAIAGSLSEVGRGKWSVDDLAGILHGMDRTKAGPTAPPGGLFLVCVEYGSRPSDPQEDVD